MVTRATLAAALLLSLGSAACTDRTYVIGALCSVVGSCPPGAGSGGTNSGVAGAGPGTGGLGGAVQLPPGTFELDLTGSGVERLPEQLLGQEPSHFLVATDARTSAWDARIGDGFDVVAGATVELGEPAPFADPGSALSHSGSAPFTSQSSWADTTAGALALELTFRAQPGATLLSQRDASGGLELVLDATGRLELHLSSGADELVSSSQELVADAWHHCLALFDSSEAVAQIFCNGQAGPLVSVPAAFEVPPSAAAATLGGAGASPVHWAELASWQAATWGPRGAWTDLARERFARLVGTYAEGASEPLPFAEVRASGAYLDMSPSDAPELRSLHPVGRDWPRIVCRPTTGSARTCGLLVEASSSQLVAPQNFTLDNWDAPQVTVTPAGARGPTGSDTLLALTPSAALGEHTLELDTPFAEGPAVLSLFARAAGAQLLRAEVQGVASVTFDLAGPSVVDSTAALVAAAEPWGDGLVRLSFSFDVHAGPGRLRLLLLASDAAQSFAGDGSVAAFAGDAELRFRSYSTPLPVFGTIQQADHLVYPAGNGNLPTGSAFSFSAEIWLPNTPLLADAAVLNANFATHYDQQINLYVSPISGSLQFWGLQGKATHWQFSNPEPVTDGNLHQVTASVGPQGATLSVDGKSTTERAGQYDLSVLDRVEIGTSTSSSGPLTGIVSRIRLAPAE